MAQLFTALNSSYDDIMQGVRITRELIVVNFFNVGYDARPFEKMINSTVTELEAIDAQSTVSIKEKKRLK